eukprot:3213790-Rhodomonas_salina.2
MQPPERKEGANAWTRWGKRGKGVRQTWRQPGREQGDRGGGALALPSRPTKASWCTSFSDERGCWVGRREGRRESGRGGASSASSLRLRREAGGWRGRGWRERQGGARPCASRHPT